MPRPRTAAWFFDLDDTLHDASRASFGPTSQAMTDYIVEHLALSPAEAGRLRERYWARYGATLLGLVRHHGVKAAHFLEQTHRLPGLEERLRASAHDRSALRRLPGLKFVLTNAPRAHALRVLGALRLAPAFDGVLAIEDMVMYGAHRPKPDARMLRHLLARLRLRAADCVLVEDVLENQKAAHRIGLRTVWMQRWVRQRGGSGTPRRVARLAMRPGYVDRRVRSLAELVRGGV